MEKQTHGGEQRHNQGEIERAAAERLKSMERSGEHKQDRHESVEKARERLNRLDKTEAPKGGQESAPKSESNHAPLRLPVMNRVENYRDTMASMRRRLKPASRAFSKVIHNPAVERVSDVVGGTVMRPSVSLGATTSAVIVAGGMYIFARANGFVLRGSEIWVGLLIGAFVGILVEAIYRSLRSTPKPKHK